MLAFTSRTHGLYQERKREASNSTEKLLIIYQMNNDKSFKLSQLPYTNSRHQSSHKFYDSPSGAAISKKTENLQVPQEQKHASYSEQFDMANVINYTQSVRVDAIKKQVETDLKRVSRLGTIIKGHHDPEDLVDRFKASDINLNFSQAEKKQSPIMPVVFISFVNLCLVLLQCLLINNSLTADQWYTLVFNGNDIIQRAQRAIVAPNITAIKQVKGDCPAPYQPLLLGSFPATYRGCICPDMTTSQSSCYEPCQFLEAQPQLKFTILQNKTLCGIYDKGPGLTTLKAGTEGKDNTIQVDDLFYEFQSIEGEESLYMFDLTSSAPCYGTMYQPMLKSELSYPFLNKPYIGCSTFGQMVEESIRIGPTTIGQLINENNCSTTIESNYPFASKYIKKNDELQLYALKKPRIKVDPVCSVFYIYSFDFSYQGSLFVQVLYLLVTQLGIIFFIISAGFLIASAIITKLRTNRHFVIKGKIDEVMCRSVIIMAVTFTVVYMISLMIYACLLFQEQGIFESLEFTNTLLQNDCLQTKGVKHSITTINLMLNSQSTSINPLLIIMLIEQIIFLAVAFYFVRRNLKNIQIAKPKDN